MGLIDAPPARRLDPPRVSLRPPLLLVYFAGLLPTASSRTAPHDGSPRKYAISLGSGRSAPSCKGMNVTLWCLHSRESLCCLLGSGDNCLLFLGTIQFHTPLLETFQREKGNPLIQSFASSGGKRRNLKESKLEYSIFPINKYVFILKI